MGRAARAELSRVRGPKNRSLTVAARKYKAAARGGFTLIEALIAVGLLVVLFAAVSQTFTIATEANGRIRAQAEMFEAAAAFENAVRDKISRIKPGLLIIDSPEPLGSVAPLRADIPNGPQTVTLRHDRLVFIAQGEPGSFESVTDHNVPSVNNGTNKAAEPLLGTAGVGTGRAYTSGEALVFFGPSNPDGRKLALQTYPAGTIDDSIAGREWIASQRIILLGAVPVGVNPAFTSYGASLPLASTSVPPLIYPMNNIANVPGPGTANAFYGCEIDAVEETGEAFYGRLVSNFAGGGFPAIQGIWDLNAAATEVVANRLADMSPPFGPYYHRRNGFALLPRVADLRIEWTDGSSIDPFDQLNDPPQHLFYQPQNPATQWFGQRRDTLGADGFLLPVAGTAEGDVCTKAEWLNVFQNSLISGRTDHFAAEVAEFGTVFPSMSIEWNPPPGGLNYFAVWGPANWQFRPKSLRFTFRVYDSADRISNAERFNRRPWVLGPQFEGDPALQATNVVTDRRWGQEFSFVVAVP